MNDVNIIYMVSVPKNCVQKQVKLDATQQKAYIISHSVYSPRRYIPRDLNRYSWGKHVRLPRNKYYIFKVLRGGLWGFCGSMGCRLIAKSRNLYVREEREREYTVREMHEISTTKTALGTKRLRDPYFRSGTTWAHPTYVSFYSISFSLFFWLTTDRCDLMLTVPVSSQVSSVSYDEVPIKTQKAKCKTKSYVMFFTTRFFCSLLKTLKTILFEKLYFR